MSIFYIAKYHGDNFHYMFDCPKDFLAAKKLSLLMWFESFYDSIIRTHVKDLSTISTISGSRNLTISTIYESRNLLVHFRNF